MVLAISVGTFKKGITGQPAFFRAVIESGEQLHQVSRLRDLPEILRLPGRPSSELPDLPVGLPQISLRLGAAYLSPLAPDLDSMAEPTIAEETPSAPPAAPKQPQKISQCLLEESVIKRRMPVYPLGARSMNACDDSAS